MPEAIVTRIPPAVRLRGLPARVDEVAQTVTCWVRPIGAAPYYCLPDCGSATQATAGRPRSAGFRDLPWGPWQVWLVVEIQTVACRRCGRHRERVPFLAGRRELTAGALRSRGSPRNGRRRRSARAAGGALAAETVRSDGQADAASAGRQAGPGRRLRQPGGGRDLAMGEGDQVSTW